MTLDLLAGTAWPAALAPMRAAPDVRADPLLGDTAVLLAEAAAATAAARAAAPAPDLRSRLARRVAQSARAAAAMQTVRHAGVDPRAGRAGPGTTPGNGVRVHRLHRGDTLALRPGEPRLSELIELAPGARLDLPATAGVRSWFVLGGALTLDGLDAGPGRAGGPLALAAHDHLRADAGAVGLCAGPEGALVLRREAAGAAGCALELQRSVDAEWCDFAPGVRRRVMWQQGGEAAMLYATAPGAAVSRHGHRHDEECLMLAGELFLDDVLLRPLDYQLAPAGTEHGGVFTDTGVLLYAHGDLELDLIAA